MHFETKQRKKAWVPISRLADGGICVLFGDHKQLGPVLRAPARLAGQLRESGACEARLASFRINRTSNKSDFRPTSVRIPSELLSNSETVTYGILDIP